MLVHIRAQFKKDALGQSISKLVHKSAYLNNRIISWPDPDLAPRIVWAPNLIDQHRVGKCLSKIERDDLLGRLMGHDSPPSHDTTPSRGDKAFFGPKRGPKRDRT